MVEEVKAHNQQEARQKFNRLNPEYKAGAANNKGRAWYLTILTDKEYWIRDL